MLLRHDVSARCSNWSYMTLRVPMSRCSTASSSTTQSVGGFGLIEDRLPFHPGGDQLVQLVLGRLRISGQDGPSVLGGLQQARHQEWLPRRSDVARRSASTHSANHDG